MSRVERAAWGLFGRLILALLAVIPFIWPLMLQNSIGQSAAWALEIVWVALLSAGAFVLYRQIAAGRRRRVQAQAEFDMQLARRRAYMASTGQAWFDAVAGHYRHGTCTIKHRSEGAAGRCSSTI